MANGIPCAVEAVSSRMQYMHSENNIGGIFSPIVRTHVSGNSEDKNESGSFHYYP